jgi:hypothetical protein
MFEIPSIPHLKRKRAAIQGAEVFALPSSVLLTAFRQCLALPPLPIAPDVIPLCLARFV